MAAAVYTSTGIRILSLGFEFELILTEGKTAYNLKSEINYARLPGVTAELSNDGHRLGGPSNKWIITTDMSISPYDKEHRQGQGEPREGAELISPIFLDDGGGELTDIWHDELDDVLRVAKGLCPLHTNASTGLHVHIGTGREGKFTFEEVQKVCLFYVTYETTIDQYHANHRSVWWSECDNDQQIKSNRFNAHWRDQALPQALYDLRVELTEEGLTRDMCPSGSTAVDRQHKLNLVSLERHHTLEFRQHEGTADASVACKWADFLLDFVRTALGLSVDQLAGIDPAVDPLSDYVPSILELPFERESKDEPVPY